MAIKHNLMEPMSLGTLLRMKLESLDASHKHLKLAIAMSTPNSVRQRRGVDKSDASAWVQRRYIRTRAQMKQAGSSLCYYNDDYCLYTLPIVDDNEVFAFLMEKLGFKCIDVLRGELDYHALEFLSDKAQITSYQKLARVVEKTMDAHLADRVAIMLHNQFDVPYRS